MGNAQLVLNTWMMRVITFVPCNLLRLHMPHVWSSSVPGPLGRLLFWKGEESDACSAAFADSFNRSGIGSTSILSKNDIQQIVDLPGVGEHLMGLF